MVNIDFQLSPPTFRYKLLGLLALPFTLTLARTRPIVIETLLATIRRVTPIATVAETERSIAAIVWAGHFYPGRVACVEVAIGACLIGASMRSMPQWCVGAKFRPLVHHNWVEGRDTKENMVPVGESEVLGGWPYKTAIRI